MMSSTLGCNFEKTYISCVLCLRRNISYFHLAIPKLATNSHRQHTMAKNIHTKNAKSSPVLLNLILALEQLGGSGTLSEIYHACRRLNQNSKEATIRRTLQQYSASTKSYINKDDLFSPAKSLGDGIWKLNNYSVKDSWVDDAAVRRIPVNIDKLVRDTALTLRVKALVGPECQLCSTTIVLPDGRFYLEAHHIKPLGSPHNGPDIQSNLLIVCPNCHVKCDRGIITLSLDCIKNNKQDVELKYILYHNNLVTLRKQEQELVCPDLTD